MAITLLLVAAAMLAVSVLQLIPSALDSGAGALQVFIATTLGFTLFIGLSLLKFGEKRAIGKNQALLITIAFSLHNFPEGAAPIGATLVDIQTGVTTSLMFALHNIPEGIAISATTLVAGYSRKMALALTSAAALAESLGALGVYFSESLLLEDRSVGILLGVVAGIMIAISTKELLPYCFKTLINR